MRAQLLHIRLQETENRTSILRVDDLDRIKNNFLYEYNAWKDVIDRENPDRWGISPQRNDDSFVVYQDHLPYVEYRVQVI